MNNNIDENNDQQTKPNGTFQQSDKVLMNILADALTNGRTSFGTLIAIQEILITAFEQTDDLFIFHPELFETSFRLIITENSNGYTRGISDALRAVLLTDGYCRDDFEEKAQEAVDDFSERILTVELAGSEYKKMYWQFVTEMRRATDEGAICTPERMAVLYPIFRKINLETDEDGAAYEKLEIEGKNRRIAAEWLFEARRTESLEVAGSVGELLAVLHLTNPLIEITVESIEKGLQMMCEMATANPDNAFLLKSARLLDEIKASSSLDTGSEIFEALGEIVSAWYDGIDDDYKEPETVEASADLRTSGEAERLAAQISAIMTNPHLPEHLRNIIAAEINEADEVDDFSPEMALHNLNVIREKETAVRMNADVPTISDVPHSKPAQKRTPTQKPKVRTKKAEKPKDKQP